LFYGPPSFPLPLRLPEKYNLGIPPFPPPLDKTQIPLFSLFDAKPCKSSRPSPKSHGHRCFSFIATGKPLLFLSFEGVPRSPQSGPYRDFLHVGDFPRRSSPFTFQPGIFHGIGRLFTPFLGQKPLFLPKDGSNFPPYVPFLDNLLPHLSSTTSSSFFFADTKFPLQLNTLAFFCLRFLSPFSSRRFQLHYRSQSPDFLNPFSVGRPQCFLHRCSSPKAGFFFFSSSVKGAHLVTH